mmetsp:Transcript_5444/g.17086  ORF Transcript_5444/g.17086 Transcript_5444/m.17086 type:complete len:209 (+) Transcript_5444:455-1081(+)
MRAPSRCTVACSWSLSCNTAGSQGPDLGRFEERGSRLIGPASDSIPGWSPFPSSSTCCPCPASLSSRDIVETPIVKHTRERAGEPARAPASAASRAERRRVSSGRKQTIKATAGKLILTPWDAPAAGSRRPPSDGSRSPPTLFTLQPLAFAVAVPLALALTLALGLSHASPYALDPLSSPPTFGQPKLRFLLKALTHIVAHQTQSTPP